MSAPYHDQGTPPPRWKTAAGSGSPRSATVGWRLRGGGGVPRRQRPSRGQGWKEAKPAAEIDGREVHRRDEGAEEARGEGVAVLVGGEGGARLVHRRGVVHWRGGCPSPSRPESPPAR